MAIEAVSEQRDQAAKTAARQRYGLLLLDLIATFLVLGIVEPGDLQRVIGSVRVGSALLLALHAARARPRTQRIALVLVVAVVLGVVVAILADHNSRTAVGLAAVANGLMIALAPPAVAIGVYRHLKANKTVTIIVVKGSCASICSSAFSSPLPASGFRILAAPRSSPMAPPLTRDAPSTSVSPR